VAPEQFQFADRESKLVRLPAGDGMALALRRGRGTIGPEKNKKMPIHWERMMAEFHQMKEFDQLRAVTKEQMEWLTEVAERVPFKHSLDLGFGCGFSAVAMVRGGAA
jgi:hypothetical protein